MKLLQKLLEIRKAVEYIQKTERGNQGAMYVDPAVLVKKIRDKMDEHNILLFPQLSQPVVEQISAPTKNNPNAMGFFFKAEMTYTWVDAESSDEIKIPWFVTAKHMTDPAMAGGAALTYFERYFLLKFFQIPTAKDDPEYFKNKTKEPEPAKQITIGQENVNWLVGFCQRNNLTEPKAKKEFQEHYKFDVFKTSVEDFEKIKQTIELDFSEVA